MENVNETREIAIQLKGVKKQYKLGQIGGRTLTADLQSWWARIRKKEDPNLKIGFDQRLIGQTFMALNGIDLTVYKGEALGIIGGNGAGKSTMLKLLSRVTAPTEGEIDINGRIASMLEVGTGFNGEMTGRENIYLNGAILGMTKAEIDAKMEDIIEFSEVRDFIDTPVKRYSSGMYVKLAFSVAAHLDSEIMIMDEVLAVGDMAFQKKCLDKMRSAAKEQGRTVLYVSHNMNTIRQLCDRCVVLNQGKVVFIGEVEEAIGVYMDQAIVAPNAFIDLSQQRMSHLPTKVDCKMQSIYLIEKEKAVYDFKENCSFILNILSYKDIENLCMRIEIRDASDTPIGASLNHDLGQLFKDEQVEFLCEIPNMNLVPGRYKVLLVIYEVDEVGTYVDLDAIWPAFVFDVLDLNGELKVKWNYRAWGRVYFDEINCERLPSKH